MTATSQRVTITDIVPQEKSGKRLPETQQNIRVDGAFVEVTMDNIKVREVHQVSGLTSDNPALEALLSPGIDLPGRDGHPTLSGLPCTRASAEMEPNCTSKAIVTSEFAYPEGAGMAYAIPPNDTAPPDIEVSTALTSVQTNEAYFTEDDGTERRKPIILRQDLIIEDPDTQTSTTKHIKISPVIETQVPMTTFIYRRKEHWTRTRGFHETHTIGDLARWYVGTLDAFGIFGDPLYTWMCTKIIAVRELQRSLWVADVTYEFQHNPLSWTIPVSILDENGYPHPDALPSTDQTGDSLGGRARVRPMRSMNFNNLDLTF